ncbi:hypothetical protein D7004_10570 [Pedobacter jejuensis]|uniref:Uncharacterized protein n=2 Tax=Pedobacter jejuensis TaxID=1268550 RepID=A0A3N0BVG6_9SPHI|nr:hypothetical protein D7004_10570 [Pedobacter jejuensis]
MICFLGYMGSFAHAQVSGKVFKKKPDTDEKQLIKTRDSLQNDLVLYLDTLEAFQEAITLLKEKGGLNKKQSINYNNLLKKREHAKFLLDSTKLEVAQKYNSNGLEEKAETLLNELLTSKYSKIRNKATVKLDTLVSEKKVRFFDEYPVEPLTKLFKPLIPFILLFGLIAFIFYFFNRYRSEKYFSVLCNDDQEKTAFRLAFDFMLNEINASQAQNTSIQPVRPGVLPFLEPEAPSVLNDVIAVPFSDNYLKLITWIWRFGVKPNHVLNVFIEKSGSDVIIKSHLKMKKKIIIDWDLKVADTKLFETRMDIVYEALIHIQIYS